MTPRLTHQGRRLRPGHKVLVLAGTGTTFIDRVDGSSLGAVTKS
jgi:hypothetical protein